MNRREFLFGSVACAVMPCFGNVGKDEIAENAVYSHEYMCNEVLKCSKDIIYFAEKYIKLPYGKHLALKDWQKKYLRHLTAGKDAVLDAYRQSGKTLMNSIYAVWKTNFAPYQKITFVAVNKHMSDGCFENIKAMYDSLPEWMRSREDKTSERYMRDKKHIVVSNQSELVVTYAHADFCGYFPGNIVILDDVAFLTDEQHVNLADTIVPVVKSCKNSQFVAASTPAAHDDLFSRYVDYVRKTKDNDMLFEVSSYV